MWTVARQHISSSGSPPTSDHPDFKSSKISDTIRLWAVQEASDRICGLLKLPDHLCFEKALQQSDKCQAAVVSVYFHGFVSVSHLLCISFISPAVFAVLFPAYQLRSCSLASPSHYPHLCISASLHLRRITSLFQSVFKSGLCVCLSLLFTHPLPVAYVPSLAVGSTFFCWRHVGNIRSCLGRVVLFSTSVSLFRRTRVLEM